MQGLFSADVIRWIAAAQGWFGGTWSQVSDAGRDPFRGIYHFNGFDLAIDYTQPPDVPLPPEVASWADALLRAAGKRP